MEVQDLMAIPEGHQPRVELPVSMRYEPPAQTISPFQVNLPPANKLLQNGRDNNRLNACSKSVHKEQKHGLPKISPIQMCGDDNAARLDLQDEDTT